MKNKEKKILLSGLAFLVAFVMWTVLIQTVDVKPVGQKGTDVGFATVNLWFHKLTGVNMTLYNITDWLGLVPLLVCMVFAVLGFVQLVKRKSLVRIDCDIILLGLYYIAVIAGYLAFEMIPINYRPILINGFMEASYPSSTTLLVLSVMPTLVFQADRRISSSVLKGFVRISSSAFSAFMVIGRLVSGVHWLTDIIGSVLFCVGLFMIYKGAVLLIINCRGEGKWNLAKSFNSSEKAEI